MEHIVGIDPGLTGALCVINKDNGSILELIKMPVTKVGEKQRKIKQGKNKGKKYNYTINGIDFTAFMNIVEKYDGALYVLEKQTAFPGFDLGTTITTLLNYGTLVGILYGMGQEHCEVMPATWKKHFELTLPRPKTAEEKKHRKSILKEMSIKKAQDLSGSTFVLPNQRVPDNNAAEAYLIAEYGRDIINE